MSSNNSSENNSNNVTVVTEVDDEVKQARLEEAKIALLENMAKVEEDEKRRQAELEREKIKLKAEKDSAVEKAIEEGEDPNKVKSEFKKKDADRQLHEIVVSVFEDTDKVTSIIELLKMIFAVIKKFAENMKPEDEDGDGEPDQDVFERLLPAVVDITNDLGYITDDQAKKVKQVIPMQLDFIGDAFEAVLDPVKIVVKEVVNNVGEVIQDMSDDVAEALDHDEDGDVDFDDVKSCCGGCSFKKLFGRK